MRKTKIFLISIMLFFLFLPVLTLAQSRAYRTDTAQAIANDTVTKIQFNAESYDSQEEFDSTTNYRFTATKAGYYLIAAQIAFGSAADQSILATMLFRNGVVITNCAVKASGTGLHKTLLTDIVYLAVGQYLEIHGYQDSGGSINVLTGESITFMAIHKFAEIPDQYSLIKNNETGAEFYLDKTFSYGDVIETVFLSIFSIIGICILTGKFVFSR